MLILLLSYFPLTLNLTQSLNLLYHLPKPFYMHSTLIFQSLTNPCISHTLLYPPLIYHPLPTPCLPLPSPCLPPPAAPPSPILTLDTPMPSKKNKIDRTSFDAQGKSAHSSFDAQGKSARNSFDVASPLPVGLGKNRAVRPSFDTAKHLYRCTRGRTRARARAKARSHTPSRNTRARARSHLLATTHPLKHNYQTHHPTQPTPLNPPL